MAGVFAAYVADLDRPESPLDADTLRAYASRVRQFLVWVADAIESGAVDGDPLADVSRRSAGATGPRALVKPGRLFCAPHASSTSAGGYQYRYGVSCRTRRRSNGTCPPILRRPTAMAASLP